MTISHTIPIPKVNNVYIMVKASTSYIGRLTNMQKKIKNEHVCVTHESIKLS